jgi:hypothetical protein
MALSSLALCGVSALKDAFDAPRSSVLGGNAHPAQWKAWKANLGAGVGLRPGSATDADSTVRGEKSPRALEPRLPLLHRAANSRLLRSGSESAECPEPGLVWAALEEGSGQGLVEP